MIRLDHTVLYANNHHRAATQFSDVMGLPFGRIAGPGYDFTAVSVNSELSIYFMDRTDVNLEQHMAFRVDGQTFNDIVTALTEMGIPYGSSPFDRENMRTEHDFAQRGLFWTNVDGCLFEVMTNN